MTSAAEDWYGKATAHIKGQRFDEARQCLERSLAVEPTANAYHDLGVLHYIHNRLNEAILALQAAVQIDPSYHQAYGNLSRILFQKGDDAKAIEYSVLAIAAKPTEKSYKEDFIQLVKMKDFSVFYPQLKETIRQCLLTEDVYHEALAHAWYSLFQKDPAFEQTHELMEEDDYESFSTALNKLHKYKELDDVFFTAGLKKLLIADLPFENFILWLRRYILEHPDFTADHLELVHAVALYCQYTGYILNFMEEEKSAADLLRKEIESGNLKAVPVYACYAPLHELENAADISRTLQNELTRVQIDEPLRERKIAGHIRALTKIENRISQNVRSQYEGFPYPRWKTLNNASPLDFFAENVNTTAPDILVAGCGTGQEAMNYAKALPHGRFLAVDLSLASLSYAIRKAEEYKITNVEFRQADILALGALDQRFDLVTCSGVLHHMEDPVQGWKTLTGLLKPGGLMRIALYSELARRDIVAAHKIIAAKNYVPTAEGIRSFRRDFPGLMNPDAVDGFVTSRDFYSLPACRDLLFHVQEHRYEIPQLAEIMKNLGLVFIKFDVEEEYRRRYLQKYPSDPELKNLSYWNAFERSHPDVFAAMYQIWCRKK